MLLIGMTEKLSEKLETVGEGMVRVLIFESSKNGN